jgi:hypothetical protein
LVDRYGASLSSHWPQISDRERHDRWWRQLQTVFGLPIPDGFPLATWNPTPDELECIDRYLELIAELFHSTALAGNYGWRFEIDEHGGEKIDAHTPSREALRAFAPLFRQFYAPGEKASFKAVYAIVSRQARADVTDAPERRTQLRIWTRAADRLRGEWLEHLFAASAGMEWPNDHGWPRPKELIDELFYAEHLHWEPAKARAAKQRRTDAFMDAWHRHLVLCAAAQLSYLYMHFGSVVLVASGAVPRPR